MNGTAIAGLYVLVDDDPRWRLDPVEQAEAALEGGASVLQLRAKHADDITAVGWGVAIRRLAGACGVPFVMNDRFDLALRCDADGVHLGQGDVPPGRLPPAVRARLLVGRSTHTLEQVVTAAREDVDYLAFGPVYATASKTSDYSPRGIPLLAKACALRGARPMVAIGGIGPGRCAEVIGAGAAAACVLSAVVGDAEPVAATRALVGELRRAGAPLG